MHEILQIFRAWNSHIFPGSIRAPYRQGLTVMEKVGFPPGTEEQGLCSGPFQLCSSAGSAEPAVGSWILQLMTAFHQHGSCCLCLCGCLTTHVAPSTQKNPAYPAEVKRVQGFLQSWGGKKSQSGAFPHHF